LVTVTDRFVPVGAVAETVMVASMVVESTTLTEEKLTPLGPVTLIPEAKPVR
jgi:hypothetical protein